MLVASRRLSSSVSSAIRFLFSDLICFIVEYAHVYICKHQAHFYCKIYQFGKYVFAEKFAESLCNICKFLKGVLLVLIKITYCNTYATLQRTLAGLKYSVCRPHAASVPVVGPHWDRQCHVTISLIRPHSLYCSCELEKKLIEFLLSSLLKRWDGGMALVTILLHFHCTRVDSRYVFGKCRWTN